MASDMTNEMRWEKRLCIGFKYRAISQSLCVFDFIWFWVFDLQILDSTAEQLLRFEKCIDNGLP